MVVTKYPADHNVLECFPLYGNLYFDKRMGVDFAFNAPITDPKLSCGVVSNKKCIWSESPFISNILTDKDIAISFKIEYNSLRIF